MYEIFEKLLEEKGVTAYAVSKATGIRPSTFTDKNIEIISDKVMDLLKEDLEQVSHVKQLENTL